MPGKIQFKFISIFGTTFNCYLYMLQGKFRLNVYTDMKDTKWAKFVNCTIKGFVL